MKKLRVKKPKKLILIIVAKVEINPSIQNLPKRFIRHVTVVETGEWINLGRFAVQPPLGHETFSWLLPKRTSANSYQTQIRIPLHSCM